ncbi:MAG: bifunctional diaminohydroxyphosphoribosylaminopyrimidine deaminase/5-amino-6-(5-phosphoribosylamino)uracil reductase RibD [Gammaproteobacteria bacterium]|nr:bifunctional diaminohydroxyphosphoribosylaminopyrimidine deaminase/5-amino-6-(5-phosphoribosylamino)uracil reductase RibD [Gammaproteobacteria bacterium]MCW5583992.1 bifunctional diaminohydroxyphosphoribosylaminopyrimidine deaminase/5-amino-6-(5-phosphoribosylamino)uracil reductase RibD [Gammaproteobacteria bacterium]
MSGIDHDSYMAHALQLAQQGQYTVSPNPMVGCVLVKNDCTIGTGFHQRAGGAHAEIMALEQAASDARGATAYITLEPCCHFGRTPPCTNALINAGIKKIFIACADPNPLMSGNSIKQLRAAGIEVIMGSHEARAKRLNEIFFHYIVHKRPFVFAKWAMSLDGKTSTHNNDNRDISCSESQISSHQLRKKVDAILIGANTAIRDNPLLTVRHQSDLIIKHPTRIVLTNRGNLPLSLNIFDSSMPGKTIVATTNKVDPIWLTCIRNKNIDVMLLPSDENSNINLSLLLDELGQREITSLLVEGGMTVHHSFFNENLVNKVHVYLAPVIIGTSKGKLQLSNIAISRISKDFYFTADNEEQ